MPELSFKGKRFNSSIELSLSIIGGKWKIPIIWILKEGSMRYSELRRSLSEITHKMLTQQLRELEQDEIIKRKVYPEVPPKVEYSLTETGKELIPFIRQLRSWGEKQMSEN